MIQPKIGDYVRERATGLVYLVITEAPWLLVKPGQLPIKHAIDLYNATVIELVQVTSV
jgi:hypothetical protein